MVQKKNCRSPLGYNIERKYYKNDTKLRGLELRDTFQLIILLSTGTSVRYDGYI